MALPPRTNPIDLQRRARSLTPWGGRIVPGVLLTVGLAICAAALLPLVVTFWVLFGAFAEFYDRRPPAEYWPVLVGVLASWTWIVVWAGWMEALQARMVRRALIGQTQTDRAIFVRVRHGSGACRVVDDLGFLRASGDQLHFFGARSAFRIRREDVPHPVYPGRSDTVFVRVGPEKGGVFFSLSTPQELAQIINGWRFGAEVVQSAPVDKPGCDG